MLRIIIVDDNVLFREGLANLLQREPGIQVVGQTGSISNAVDMAHRLGPDLVLLDADLAGIDHFNCLRVLRIHRPAMQMVLIGERISEDKLVEAVRHGAWGFLAKDHSTSRFMASIHAIERGEAVIPRALVGSLLDEISHRSFSPAGDGREMLTSREVEVLSELGQGYSNGQIAERLFISENTVKVHVHNILNKLNLHNRRQAAHYARSQGILYAPLPEYSLATVE
jgi:DNA-binding NarL/FixJ family response regulator